MKQFVFGVVVLSSAALLLATEPNDDWPSFRGAGAKGVATGHPTPTKWNADKEAGETTGVLWQVDVPGLGHSSPVIAGNRLFLATAIASDGDAPLNVGRSGRPTAADDHGEQSWVLLCYDKRSGKELWRKTAKKGVPRATRHVKSTHANTSVAVDGDDVVAFFGSEGMHCYDLEGNLKWSRDWGVINISKYGIGWGYASSPAIYGDRIFAICDDPENPFLAAFRRSDGEQLWRVSRKDICVRSWGTPYVHPGENGAQVVINGWPWVVAYDADSGKEIWKIHDGGDNPVPTPFAAHGSIYITSAHGKLAPIYVVRPNAKGDITPEDGNPNEAMVWSTLRGGSYMSTPVVYGDYLFLGGSNGVVRCFNAKTGEEHFEKRLGRAAGVIASLVAADDKIYCASENGTVYVLAASPEYKLLAENKMGAPVLASPAISAGVLYFRTTKSLIAVK